jgi:hypothetical protein
LHQGIIEEEIKPESEMPQAPISKAEDLGFQPLNFEEEKHESTPNPNPETLSNPDLKMESKAEFIDNPEFAKSAGGSSKVALSEHSQIQGPRSAVSQMSSSMMAAQRQGGKSPLKRSAFDKPRLSKEEDKVFQEMFRILDYEKSGLVSPQEIVAVLKGFSKTIKFFDNM